MIYGFDFLKQGIKAIIYRKFYIVIMKAEKIYIKEVLKLAIHTMAAFWYGYRVLNVPILQENMGVETTDSCIDSKMDYGKVSQDKAG